MGPKRPLLTPSEQRVSPGQATPSLEARCCGSTAMGHFLGALGVWTRDAPGRLVASGGLPKMCSDNQARRAGTIMIIAGFTGVHA